MTPLSLAWMTVPTPLCPVGLALKQVRRNARFLGKEETRVEARILHALFLLLCIPLTQIRLRTRPNTAVARTPLRPHLTPLD